MIRRPLIKKLPAEHLEDLRSYIKEKVEHILWFQYLIGPFQVALKNSAPNTVLIKWTLSNPYPATLRFYEGEEIWNLRKTIEKSIEL